MENIKLNQLTFNDDGLIPTVVQEKITNEILMVAYSNKKSLELTLNSHKAHFWSRSRNKIWLKGETSGNTLKLFDIYTDCDTDTLIFKVELRFRSLSHRIQKLLF